MRFLAIDGTSKSLSRINEVLGLEGERKVEEPEEIIGKPWTFPMKIWSGPSKGAHYWMF